MSAIATCIGCGCTDHRACVDVETGMGCHWVRLDRIQGEGVCSVCRDLTAIWDTLAASNVSSTILTASGRYFDLIRPDNNLPTLGEIAHALAHICRYTGHVSRFYSVAQHSVLVSRIVPPMDARAGLLHDMAEAFIGDVSRPLKQLLPAYKWIERRIEADLFCRFGLPQQMPESVKRADLILLATEQRDLMPAHADDWACLAGIEPLADRIEPVSPEEARRMFMDRAFELTEAA